MRVLMIYPEFPDTFWSFKHALKFINKKITNPPLGLMTISPLLPAEWERKLVDTNISRLTESDIQWADIVFISAMSVQRPSVEKIVKRVKAKRKFVVAGGPLFTGETENFKEIDAFVLNEGEITLPQLIEDMLSGKAIQKVYSTPEYADMKASPLPDISLISMKDYDCMSIQFSRGCPFHCDFCNVTSLLGHNPRVKSTGQLIAELDQLYQAGWRRNIFFVDDNFIGNKKIIKEEVLPALIEWKKGKEGCNFITEASINLADDKKLMDMMSQAGFINVFIGIETPCEESLAECGKAQNSNRNLLENIRIIQSHGLQVMGGFILGFDNDPGDIFDRLTKFIQDSGIVTAMVGILQAPFGTALYHRLSGEKRIIHEMSGDNSDGTTNIIPKMDPSALKSGYFKVMNDLYSPGYLYPRIKTFLTHYNPRLNKVKLQLNEIIAFFKSIFLLGLNRKEGNYYWRLLFWTLAHDARKFALAVTLTIYGYHFRKVTHNNMRLLGIS